jgi:hypothetical protein
MATFKENFYTNVMPKIYGIGAAVVILGAMFKILDWQGANIMIGVGLTTEAIIFFLSAFEPVSHPTVVVSTPGPGPGPSPFPPDKITPELIEKLRAGMENLAESAKNMGTLSDAAVATNEYASQVKKASQSLAGMNDAYAKTAEALVAMSSASQDAGAYQAQIQAATRNLTSLNAVYELEIQDTSEMKNARKNLSVKMSESLESFVQVGVENQIFREELVKLNKNVTELNRVYGKMVSAFSS